jgi:transposase
LTQDIAAENLVADKGYDTNEIIENARHRGMTVVIPPRKHRVAPRNYDRYLYRLRHLVENAILKLKGWRGIATRYVKNASSFLAAVQSRCLYLWLKIS